MDAPPMTTLVGWFSDYCSRYYGAHEGDNRNYRLKEEHTGHVRSNILLLADSVVMGERDRALAEAVALLHDVGRFEQYRRFGTFKDSDSTNHALLGVRVLAEEGVLDFLPAGERRLVLRAVALHNVFRIPEVVTGHDLLFVQLIRDADKLDIWRVFIEYYEAPPEERASAVALGFPDRPEVSPVVVEALMKEEMVNLASLATLNDFKLLQLSWVFDLNIPRSFDLVLERGYVARLAKTLPDFPAVRNAVAFVERYLEERRRGL